MRQIKLRSRESYIVGYWPHNRANIALKVCYWAQKKSKRGLKISGFLLICGFFLQISKYGSCLPIPYSISKSFVYFDETPTTRTYSTTDCWEILRGLELHSQSRCLALYKRGLQMLSHLSAVQEYGSTSTTSTAVNALDMAYREVLGRMEHNMLLRDNYVLHMIRVQ